MLIICNIATTVRISVSYYFLIAYLTSVWCVTHCRPIAVAEKS